MKKAIAIALLVMVSWALAGTPAQAAESSHQGVTMAKHPKKQKHHKKKHKKA